MADYGFAMRDTAPYVTNPAGVSFVDAVNYTPSGGDGGLSYPVSYSNGITGGQYSGSGIEKFNVSTSVDARLAGAHRTNSNTQTQRYRFDLPATGDYSIRCAAGIANYSTGDDWLDLYDTSTQLGPLVNDTDGHTNNSFYDATGVLHTAANWPANNAATTKTFATTIMYVDLGRGTGGVNKAFLAFFQFSDVGGGGPSAFPEPYYQMLRRRAA